MMDDALSASVENSLQNQKVHPHYPIPDHPRPAVPLNACSKWVNYSLCANAVVIADRDIITSLNPQRWDFF